MANKIFYIKQGTTLPEIQSTLKDANGSVLNLTSCTVKIRFKLRTGRNSSVIEGDASIVAPNSGGIVKYKFSTTNTSIPGTYDLEWKVTYPDNSTLICPGDGYNKIKITKTL